MSHFHEHPSFASLTSRASTCSAKASIKAHGTFRGATLGHCRDACISAILACVPLFAVKFFALDSLTNMVMELPQNDFSSRPTATAATPRPGTSLSETVGNQDSGHESTASTPEMPSTPHAEQGSHLRVPSDELVVRVVLLARNCQSKIYVVLEVHATDAATAAVLEGYQQFSVQVIFPAGEPSLKLEVSRKLLLSSRTSSQHAFRSTRAR